MSSLPGDATGGVTAGRWTVVAPGLARLTEWRVRPVGVLRIAIAVLLVGQLGRIPVLSTGTREAPLLVNDLAVLAVIALTALAALARRTFRIDAVALLIFAVATIGFVTALLAVPRFGLDARDLVVSLAYLARFLVYFAIYLVVVNVVHEDEVVTLWRTLEAMMLVFAVFGILQAIFLPHFAQLVYPNSRMYIDWDEQGHRLVSTVLEPNIAGSMIMIVLLMYLAQLSTGERVPLWKPVLMFGALVASLSRSSFLGLAVGGVMIIAIRGISRRMLRFAAVLGILILATLPQLIAWAQRFGKLSVSDPSAMSRVVSWMYAIRILADHPVFGVGFNTFGYVALHYGGTLSGASTFGSDGGLLFIAAMTGIVGMACYAAMLYLIVRRCRRVWRNPLAPVEFRSLAVGIAAVTVAACVTGAFVNMLLTPFPMEMLWILWGLTFVISSASAGAASDERAPRVVAVRMGTSRT